jgi:hypothetical protein
VTVPSKSLSTASFNSNGILFDFYVLWTLKNNGSSKDESKLVGITRYYDVSLDIKAIF